MMSGVPKLPPTGVLLSFVLLFIFVLPHSYASETVIVNKAFNGLDTEHFKILSVKHVDRGKGGEFVRGCCIG